MADEERGSRLYHGLAEWWPLISPPEEYAEIDMVPTSLNAVLDNLEADHEFLTQGDVFTPDLIETWIAYKRTNEIDPIRLRPHPHEFELYYGV